MQTERVTFLTSREHKAALDDFALRCGQSVGNVVREATSRYIAQPREESDEEAELAALAAQVNEALPKMNAAIDEMIEAMRTTHDEVDRSLLGGRYPQMSAMGNALAALKSVVLMQERLDAMRVEQNRVAEDLRGLNSYILAVDKRVVRIEAMIEMSARREATSRIEGN